MPKLRRLSGKEIVKILEGLGFKLVRVRGSHHQMQRIVGDKTQTLIVPVHGSKSLATGTLKALYRQASEYIEEAELRLQFYTD